MAKKPDALEILGAAPASADSSQAPDALSLLDDVSRETMGPEGARIGLAGAAEARRRARVQFARALPGIGGLIGAHVGGIPGATILGLAGRVGGMALEGQPLASSPGGVVGQVAPEGVKQGLGALAGLGIAKGVGAAGGVAMRAALGRGGTSAMAKTALGERIMTTAGGAKKLQKLIDASTRETASHIARATARGVNINPSLIALEVEQELLPVAGNRALPVVKKLQQMTQTFVRAHGSRMTPAKLQALKQQADALLERYYSKLPPGQRPDPRSLPFVQRYHLEFANKARQALENTVEGVAESNARSAELFRLQQQLGRTTKGSLASQLLGPFAVRPAIGATIGGATSPEDRRGGALRGAIASSLALSPAGLSTMGLIGTNPALLQLLRLLPHAGMAAEAASQPTY